MSVSTTAKYLTSGQVARLLVVSKGTVLRAVRTGTLHAAYRMPGGGLRFLPADVDRYRQSLQLAPQLPAVASTAAGPLPVPASAALVAGAATADAGTFPPAASVDLPSPAVIAGTSGRPAEIVSSVLTLLAKGVRVGATCVARRIQGHWQIDQLYDRAGMGLRVVTAPPYSSVYGQALAEGRLPSLLVEDLRADARFAGAVDSATWRLGALAVVPLAWANGHPYGALCLLHPSARPMLREEMSQLRLAARIIMQALEAADLLERAQAARYDSSTTQRLGAAEKAGRQGQRDGEGPQEDTHSDAVVAAGTPPSPAPSSLNAARESPGPDCRQEQAAIAQLLEMNNELAVLARESQRKVRSLERTVASLQAEGTPRSEAAAALGPDA